MSPEYNQSDSEYATAVAATAFAIHSLEEAREDYRRKMREDYESSRDKAKTKKLEIRTGQPTSGRMARESSQKEIGEPSMKKFPESGFPASKRRDPSTGRSMLPGSDAQDRKASSRRRGDLKAKADAWEKAQMEKLRKRHEKMKMDILAWENEKKKRVKVSMDRKKRESDQRTARTQQYYQIKIARIDQMAGGARAQADETRRNEESRVKERANRIRSGKAPFKCFCCYCPV